MPITTVASYVARAGTCVKVCTPRRMAASRARRRLVFANVTWGGTQTTPCLALMQRSTSTTEPPPLQHAGQSELPCSGP